MTNTHKHSRRLTTRREEVRRQNPVSGTNETQSPSTHRRPEKTQTNEGYRPPDQTRPPDPQRRPTDPPESALTSNCRSMSELEVDGAAEFGALRRLRRRPRRQPAVSAAARAWAVTRGGQARRRGRARPPQLPTMAVYILAQVHHARWSIFCFQRHASASSRSLREANIEHYSFLQPQLPVREANIERRSEVTT